MNIGEFFRSERKKRGLTIDELATKVKLSKMTVIRIEEDHSKLLFINVVNICEALNIDIAKIAEIYKEDKKYENV